MFSGFKGRRLEKLLGKQRALFAQTIQAGAFLERELVDEEELSRSLSSINTQINGIADNLHSGELLDEMSERFIWQMNLLFRELYYEKLNRMPEDFDVRFGEDDQSRC